MRLFHAGLCFEDMGIVNALFTSVNLGYWDPKKKLRVLSGTTISFRVFDSSVIRLDGHDPS